MRSSPGEPPRATVSASMAIRVGSRQQRRCRPPERRVRVRPCPCPYCRRLTSTSHESASIHRRLVCVVGLCWPWPWVQVHEFILVLTTLLCVCCEICTIHASFPCSVYFVFLLHHVLFSARAHAVTQFSSRMSRFRAVLSSSDPTLLPNPARTTARGLPFLRSPTLFPVFTILYRI